VPFGASRQRACRRIEEPRAGRARLPRSARRRGAVVALGPAHDARARRGRPPHAVARHRRGRVGARGVGIEEPRASASRSRVPRSRAFLAPARRRRRPRAGPRRAARRGRSRATCFSLSERLHPPRRGRRTRSYNSSPSSISGRDYAASLRASGSLASLPLWPLSKWPTALPVARQNAMASGRSNLPQRDIWPAWRHFPKTPFTCPLPLQLPSRTAVTRPLQAERGT